MKTMPFLVLALLVVLGAVMLHRAPVQRYVVACERTTQVACDLEQARSAGTQRRHVPFADDADARVRIVPRRRGTARVLLYLESAAGAIFAAEFEGADAAEAAESAAARLNVVLKSSIPGVARVEVVPPRLLRWLAWGALAVMGLLVAAGYREVRARARPA